MKTVKKLLRSDITSVILPLAVLFAVLLIGSKGFLSEYNMISVMQNVSIYVLIGLAQMSALSLGQFNLAVGAMGGLSAIMMGLFMQILKVPLLPAVIIGLIISVILGGFQGVLISKTGISPFILTLALQSIYTGMATVITMGNSYNELPEMVKTINRMKFGPVPLTFLIALFICAIAFVVFHYMDIGRRLIATGANQRAAKFSGINVDNNVILGHALSGFFAGCAAFIQICKFNSAQLAIGADWMMTSFVVAVLGGTQLSGGKISVIGTFFGSLLMTLINNALGLWKVNTYMFETIMGVLLLIAYEIDRTRLGFIKKQSVLDIKEDETE